MDAKLRIEKLEEIKQKHSPQGSKRIPYKTRKAMDMDAFEIPLECLIFNKYNARIGTFVKTYEKQHGPINPETDDGKKLIADFLWRSKESRNKATLKDIEERGQLVIGIVTKDGVIIDGNRRCMLLERAQRNHFLAVILDDELKDNPREIRQLETVYQLGMDEKVDYNPIEKYLKCRDLRDSDNFREEQIAEMMRETPGDIRKYLDTLELMDEYLEYIGYSQMYSILSEEAVEGPFVDLVHYLQKHKSGSAVRDRDWNPKPTDIDDLRNICFDYIRAGYRTAHNIRRIGNPSKGAGLFSHEKIWKQFTDKYADEIEPVNDSEQSIEALRGDYGDLPIEDLIVKREDAWKTDVGRPNDRDSKLRSNLEFSIRSLEDLKSAQAPAELLRRALGTLESIDVDHASFNEDILEDVKKISRLTWDFQQRIKNKQKQE